MERCLPRGFASRQGLLAALHAGDRAAHSAFRYAVAEELCRRLATLGPTFRAVYIYGSAMDGRAGAASDVDVIVWVRRKTDAVESFLARLDYMLAKGVRALLGGRGPDQLFDVHLVDDAEVEGRKGFGAVLQSLWTAPVCIWKR
ncbi:MAG: hypothetical protein ACP5G2_06650 [Candidatus Bipolaricaulaceae bacterium]